MCLNFWRAHVSCQSVSTSRGTYVTYVDDTPVYDSVENCGNVT